MRIYRITNYYSKFARISLRFPLQSLYPKTPPDQVNGLINKGCVSLPEDGSTDDEEFTCEQHDEGYAADAVITKQASEDACFYSYSF